jgi:hypothetical protein
MLRPSNRDAIFWQKGSASAASNCVEVALVNHLVWVRDSKAPDGPVLLFTQADWRCFLNVLRSRDVGS